MSATRFIVIDRSGRDLITVVNLVFPILLTQLLTHVRPASRAKLRPEPVQKAPTVGRGAADAREHLSALVAAGQDRITSILALKSIRALAAPTVGRSLGLS